jgi:hypothetical protein
MAAKLLAAQFSTNLHISEALPAAAVQVNYELDEPGSKYVSNGPTHNPFTVDFPFPGGATKLRSQDPSSSIRERTTPSTPAAWISRS